MNRLKRRSGVTFLELMVSLPTATVLIGAMAMCITITMRSKSQDDSLFRTTYDLAGAASQIASDLELATAHVTSSATHIEFVVPDRDGDALPEQMRYEWGGATGANANKVLWKYKNQAASVLFDNVGAFSIQTNSTSVSATVPNHLLSETAILKSIDALEGGEFREYVINTNNAIGQYFIPDIPGVGKRWDLGSIRIMARAADSELNGVLKVRIMRSNTTKLPIAPVLAEVDIAESTLGTTYQWLDIPIAPISWQTQGTPLCITLSYGGGTGDVARVQFLQGGASAPTQSNLITSNNGGVLWTLPTGATGLRFYAYGFYNGYTGQRTFLTSVDLKLESSLNTTRKIETSVRVNAAPELP
jgi:hypothetical protein